VSPLTGSSLPPFLLSLCWGYGLLSALAIVFAVVVARKQIKASEQNGDGLAIAGLVIGILGAIVAVIIIIIIIIIAAAAVSSSSGYSSTY
jgi:prolipoprotein diacylglyceryltransferase